LFFIYLDRYDRGVILRAGLFQGSLQIFARYSPNGVGTQAGSIAHKVYRDSLAIQLITGGVAKAVIGAKPAGTQGLGKPANTAESVIVEQDDVDLYLS
jgi:hypothetical protein